MTHSCTFVSIFVQQIRYDEVFKSNSKNSTYLCKLRVCGLLFRKYKLQNFRIKQLLSRLNSLRRHVILTIRNDKKYINFEIFCRSRHKLSQTRINAYTLIL